jgi:hypothetical protein
MTRIWWNIVSELKELTDEIVDWADLVFPDRTPESALIKLYTEIGELSEDLTQAGEYADIFIMLLDLADMHGVDVAAAIRDKIKVNAGRTWKRNKIGTYQHE